MICVWADKFPNFISSLLVVLISETHHQQHSIYSRPQSKKKAKLQKNLRWKVYA